MVAILNKDKLYKKTGWFSQDCEKIIHDLAQFGLVICEKKEVEKNNMFCELCEDDLK